MTACFQFGQDAWKTRKMEVLKKKEDMVVHRSLLPIKRYIHNTTQK